MNNINTKEYWDTRFKLNWDNLGKQQTQEYAKANVAQLQIPSDFRGTILDFGCALGDALPIYKAKFKNASLSGIDLSDEAIAECKKVYNEIAEFYSGDYKNVQDYDIIIASHVMEHITDDRLIVKALLLKCKELYIFVPYKETPLYKEHVNYYEEDYYSEFNVIKTNVFTVSYIQNLPFKGTVKNILKGKLSNKTRFSKDIIMFRIQGSK